nr:MAG TPA: hypothetical protein [Caudoviricetes sp.]
MLRRLCFWTLFAVLLLVAWRLMDCCWRLSLLRYWGRVSGAKQKGG